MNHWLFCSHKKWSHGDGTRKCDSCNLVEIFVGSRDIPEYAGWISQKFFQDRHLLLLMVTIVLVTLMCLI